ncbi:MAG: 16S rRNA (guanine(527)-N(7))-methyltransferase RsmG [Jhaorihella sp.]
MSGNDRALPGMDVSRETLDRLHAFENVLRKWNRRINLVSQASLDNLWHRHIADSVQVFRSAAPRGHWVDMGSGGGFPGLVVAVLAASERHDMKVTLIESDQRKAAFLRVAARETGATCTVLAERIESVPPQGADTVSARALADLGTLLGYVQRHLKATGTALFPKGVTWEKELSAARGQWRFDAEPITSRTEAGAVILKIQGVSRA